jgi:cell division protein DivIC
MTWMICYEPSTMIHEPNQGNLRTMKLLTHLPAWLKNKYFISLAVFASIMLFFDKNDLFSQQDRLRNLRELEQSKKYFARQIAAENKELEAFKHDPATPEKHAREKYLMKRDNEDLFVIPEKHDN